MFSRDLLIFKSFVTEAMAAPAPVAGGSGSVPAPGGSAPGPDVFEVDDPMTDVAKKQRAEPPAEEAAVKVGSPMLWMTGGGQKPTEWWADCSQQVASVLEKQCKSGVPVATYTFYGSLQDGPLSLRTTWPT